MEGGEGELLLDRLAVVHLSGVLQEGAEFFCAALQLGLLVVGQSRHLLVPGTLALPDLLDEVDA